VATRGTFSSNSRCDRLALNTLSPTEITPEVRDRVLDMLREGLTAGNASLDEYETAIEAALNATREAELTELVRKFAPPVRLTPQERRHPEPLTIETSGMFNDIKMRNRWQVAQDLTVKTSGSRIVLDFSDAEFDDWTIDLKTHASLGDVTIIVPRGMTVQQSGMTVAAVSRLDPPLPGYPIIRLSAKLNFGKLRLKHPRESRRDKKKRLKALGR
jgi:hypothetical protein